MKTHHAQEIMKFVHLAVQSITQILACRIAYIYNTSNIEKEGKSVSLSAQTVALTILCSQN
jgi:hypothetical protein